MMGQVIIDQKLVMYAFSSSVPCSSAVNYIFNLISEHIAHAILYLLGKTGNPNHFLAYYSLPALVCVSNCPCRNYWLEEVVVK